MACRYAPRRTFMHLDALAAAALLLILGGWLGVAARGGEDPPATAAPAIDAKSRDSAADDVISNAAFESSERTDRPKPEEQARQAYLGRVLAEPMSHVGAAWLVRPERELEENATRALKQLRLRPGMNVCDLGCGNGYWTLPIARIVGAQGRVFAVDIQPEMLQQLKARVGRARLRNVEPILGDVDAPRLPAEVSLDLVLMVDVYHEFSHPQSMLWAIRNSLAPEGVVALLEYREEDPRVPIKPLHKMSKRQIMREYHENGFKLVREFNELPWQHLMFFARDDSPLEEIDPIPFTVE